MWHVSLQNPTQPVIICLYRSQHTERKNPVILYERTTCIPRWHDYWLTTLNMSAIFINRLGNMIWSFPHSPFDFYWLWSALLLVKFITIILNTFYFFTVCIIVASSCFNFIIFCHQHKKVLFAAGIQKLTKTESITSGIGCMF